MALSSLLRTLRRADELDRFKLLKSLTEEQKKELRYHWNVWARADQMPPAGDWRLWLIMAGRGFSR